MNMENLKFLKVNIKDIGFGESLSEELEKNIQAKPLAFDLNLERQVDDRPVIANLHFKKSNSTDMYFFNSYHMTVQRANGEQLTQQFHINRGRGVSAIEAYGLLNGQALRTELINSKGENYKVWMQLDFENKDDKGNFIVNRYNDNYGFDLREAIAKFPVQQLDGGEKERDLIQALEAGNTQMVTLETGGEPLKVFIDANPKYKTINVYDEKMKPLKHEHLPKAQRVLSETKQSQPVDTQTTKEKKSLKQGGETQDRNRSRQNQGNRIQ